MQFDKCGVVLRYGLAWLKSREMLLDGLSFYTKDDSMEYTFDKLSNKYNLPVDKIEQTLMHCVAHLKLAGYIKGDSGPYGIKQFYNFLNPTPYPCDYVFNSRLPNALAYAVSLYRNNQSITYKVICRDVGSLLGVDMLKAQSVLRQESGALFIPENIILRSLDKMGLGTYKQICLYVFLADNYKTERVE